MFKKSDFDLDANVPDNLNYLGYLRMYWRSNMWNHRFFNSNNETSTMGGITGLRQKEIDELNKVINEIAELWPDGCDMKMKRNLEALYNEKTKRNQYLLEADGFLLNYQLLCDTTYGNSDYPIRIYMFRK